MPALEIGYRPSETQNAKVGCFKAIASTTYQSERQWLCRHRPKHDIKVSTMNETGLYLITPPAALIL
jgi:hypothetical protein